MIWFYLEINLKVYKRKLGRIGFLYVIVLCLIWGFVNTFFVLVGVIVINNNFLEIILLLFS